MVFEPGRVVSKCLEKSMEFNKVTNMTLVKKGVSDKSGVAEFFIDTKSTGGSSLVRRHVDKTKKNIERIDLVSLDDYVRETSIVPSMVKVDVEGAENLVVFGAKNIIKNHRPNFIIECDNLKILENIDLWTEAFNGYKFRKIGTKDFSNITKIESVVKKYINEGIKVMDILLIPNEV